jgi:putative inorganic carbon (HCO3(-)) transporter
LHRAGKVPRAHRNGQFAETPKAEFVVVRAIFLLLLFLGILVRTVGAPQAGVLGWTWLTLMTPNQLVWGFVSTLPLNLILAIVTLICWGLSPEPKRLPLNLAMGLWLSFMVYITLTTVFALAPDLAWERWDRTIKVMALGLLVASIMTNQIRIHSLVWVIVLSLGFFGVRGGVFTLITGGGFHVLGAESSSLTDNNYLALALCTIIPLMNYLRMQSEWRWVRIGMIVGMGLMVLAIIGTYSRGGLIGLAVMGGYLWWRSRQKILIAAIGIVILIPALQFMPDIWHQRMATIETAEEDASFQGRVQAWHFAINVAESRPLLGAGFGGSETTEVFNAYFHDPEGGRAPGHSAHSIYFQVLGDHGFVALAIYLGMLAATWWYTGTIRRIARPDPTLAWARDLASMIQVSLLGFMVAGAGLSMAYYDMIYLLIGITVALQQLVLRTAPRTESLLPQPLRAGGRVEFLTGGKIL